LSRLEASNGVDSVDSGRAKQPVVDSDEIDSSLPLGQTAETETVAVWALRVDCLVLRATDGHTQSSLSTSCWASRSRSQSHWWFGCGRPVTRVRCRSRFIACRLSADALDICNRLASVWDYVVFGDDWAKCVQDTLGSKW